MTRRTAFLGVVLSGLLVGDALGWQAVGNLVFCKRQRGQAGTYVGTADGRNPKRIMFLCGPEVSPRFAPDGLSIVFSSAKAGKPSVWIADREGRDRKEACEGDQATWSPDGSKILFRRAGQIVERVLQSKEERIVSPPGWTSCAFPDCSPDGKSLLFVAEVEKRTKLFVMAAGGREPEAVADLAVASPARWSPDGRRIAYSDGAHIVVAGADRTWRYRLTTGGGLDRYPAWSPSGTLLAYCHAPIVNGGWTLCVTTADGRQTRVLVKEDDAVSVFGPDWQATGVKPAEAAAAIRPPPRVSVWDAAGSPSPVPGRCHEWVQKWEGWKRVTGARALDGAVVLENDGASLVLHPRASLVVLCPKPIADPTQAIELVPVGENGEEARKVASLTLARNDGEEAVVELTSSTPGGQVVRTSWRMSGRGPFVQVSPGEHAGSVRIRAPMKHAVIPDRFADDLLYGPASYGGARVALPGAPMVLGFVGSGDTVLELATPGDGQTIDLLNEAGPAKPFSGAEVRFAKTGVVVGVLTGQGLWHEERPNAKYERRRMDLSWLMPGSGAWRLAVRVDGRVYSETCMLPGSQRLEGRKLFLTSQEEFAGLVDLVLVYLYGRSPATPPAQWTPTEIALEGMGLESFLGALDIEGLQAYRTAPRQTTWADAFATLRSLSHLYDRGAEKQEQAFAEHLCDDIPAFLEGMDGRLDAFVAFTRDVAGVAKGLETAPPMAQAFLARIKPAVDRLDDACRKREKLPAAAEAAGYAAQIKELTSKDTKDTSDKRRKFSALADKLSQAATGRAEAIRAFRNAARELRDRAGMSCAEQPELRGPAMRIRELAHGVLRNRYHFEGGWRGELYRVAPFWLGGSPY